LTNKEYQMLRDSALRLIRALRVEGGCNVQFALDPHSFRYYVIEVNPRVSRSSALASKASGYPIARVSAKISVGMTLDEIPLVNTPASFEPALDYVVTKMPRFPFDKFADANQKLGTQMKATGEVMSIGRTFEESLLKAIRSLETGVFHLYMEKFDEKTKQKIHDYIQQQVPLNPVEQLKQDGKIRLEHYQKFYQNGTYERSRESGTEANYDMVDGLVNNQKKNPEKISDAHSNKQNPRNQQDGKPKKRRSVIKRLHQKQIAIARRSGKPIPKYLDQEMERKRG